MVHTGDPSRVVEIDPLRDARWDEFVAGHPRASGHHLGVWSQILHSCYGYRPRYLALEAGGLLTGVLPLVSSGRRLTGSRLSSLPTAKAAGPLAGSTRDGAALLDAALEVSRREGLGSLMVRSQSPGIETAGVKVGSVSTTQVLDLDRPPEQLLDSYRESSKNVYRSIRKAQKAGLTVTEARSDRELRDWYRLYLLTIRRHRNLPRRLRQLREARAGLGDRWRLVTVSRDGAMIAGGVFHDIAGTVELVYNASDSDSLALRPNHALYWHMICDSHERGRAAFDFGVSAHASLEQFKRQWGTTARDVYFYRDSPAGEHAPVQPLEPVHPGEPVEPVPVARAAQHAEPDEPGSGPAGPRPGQREALSERAKGLIGDVLETSPPLVTRAMGAVAYRLV